MKAKIFFALLCFFSISAIAEETKSRADWHLCKTDDDCVHLDFYCAGGVVHKSFAQDAEEYYRKENARSNCQRPDPSESEKKIPYRVFCKNNKCGVRGVKPKGPGFS